MSRGHDTGHGKFKPKHFQFKDTVTAMSCLSPNDREEVILPRNWNLMPTQKSPGKANSPIKMARLSSKPGADLSKHRDRNRSVDSLKSQEEDLGDEYADVPVPGIATKISSMPPQEIDKGNRRYDPSGSPQRLPSSPKVGDMGCNFGRTSRKSSQNKNMRMTKEDKMIF
jgi:hypothetical protein